MIGHPLPIAVLETKRVPDGLGGYTMEDVVTNDPMVASVRFEHLGEPRFTAIEPGKYLVIWNSETKREEISIEVTEPAAAAITRHQNHWRKIVNDQLMEVDFAYSSGWSVSAHTVQTREYMPFEHVSHTFLVELDADEECILAVTTTATDRQWMLAAWRLPTVIEPNRPNANLLVGFARLATTVSPSITQTQITSDDAYLSRFRFFCTTGSGGQIRWLATPTPGYSMVAKIRVFVDSTDTALAGGSLILSIKKDSTVLATATVSIPTDASIVELTHPIAVGVFTGTQALWLEITDIDYPERFEAEASVNVD